MVWRKLFDARGGLERAVGDYMRSVDGLKAAIED